SHLASACETANIVIFGPTSPLRVGPLNTQNSIIVRNTEIDCLECYQRKCKIKGIENKKCMNSISPNRIVDLALILLDKVEKFDR
ncbi:MAG TPA: glycosyltransferase family 9 protein, partial [Exilispira sp.]|nr:glycosyltransferase family 9 protein [Exilispira sp.]